MGANSPSLGTELFQLMFGQKADQAFGNGLRLGG
jgi:hypothetical protein